MNRSFTKSYVEYALLAAALLTGCFLTTLSPGETPEAPSTSNTASVTSPSTFDVIGFDVDERRLHHIASVC